MSFNAVQPLLYNFILIMVQSLLGKVFTLSLDLDANQLFLFDFLKKETLKVYDI